MRILNFVLLLTFVAIALAAPSPQTKNDAPQNIELLRRIFGLNGGRSESPNRKRQVALTRQSRRSQFNPRRRSKCLPGMILNIAGECTEPIIERRVFVYTSPDDLARQHPGLLDSQPKQNIDYHLILVNKDKEGNPLENVQDSLGFESNSDFRGNGNVLRVNGNDLNGNGNILRLIGNNFNGNGNILRVNGNNLRENGNILRVNGNDLRENGNILRVNGNDLRENGKVLKINGNDLRANGNILINGNNLRGNGNVLRVNGNDLRGKPVFLNPNNFPTNLNNFDGQFNLRNTPLIIQNQRQGNSQPQQIILGNGLPSKFRGSSRSKKPQKSVNKNGSLSPAEHRKLIQLLLKSQQDKELNTRSRIRPEDIVLPIRGRQSNRNSGKNNLQRYVIVEQSNPNMEDIQSLIREVNREANYRNLRSKQKQLSTKVTKGLSTSSSVPQQFGNQLLQFITPDLQELLLNNAKNADQDLISKLDLTNGASDSPSNDGASSGIETATQTEEVSTSVNKASDSVSTGKELASGTDSLADAKSEGSKSTFDELSTILGFGSEIGSELKSTVKSEGSKSTKETVEESGKEVKNHESESKTSEATEQESELISKVEAEQKLEQEQGQESKSKKEMMSEKDSKSETEISMSEKESEAKSELSKMEGASEQESKIESGSSKMEEKSKQESGAESGSSKMAEKSKQESGAESGSSKMAEKSKQESGTESKTLENKSENKTSAKKDETHSTKDESSLKISTDRTKKNASLDGESFIKINISSIKDFPLVYVKLNENHKRNKSKN